MKERSYNVRDQEDFADQEMKEKCLDVNGERDVEKKTTDDNVGVKQTLSENLRSRKVTLIIILLCVLLLVFFIIIIALAVRVGRLERRTDVQECQTGDCLGASAKIVKIWNTTFDPCQDFWRFSCGKWLKKHPVPPNRGSVEVKDLLRQKVQGNLRHLLDLVPHDASVRDPDWKAQRFYHVCMNVEAVEQTESNFKNILNEEGGWVLLNNWSSNRWDRGPVIQRLHVEYGITPLFKVTVQPDDATPTTNIIKLFPSGLGLPGPSYYFKDPPNKFETIYKNYMDDVARELGATVSEANRFAVNIFNFEKRLAEAMPAAEAYRDPFSHYMKVSIRQLSTLAPTIQWLELLQQFYPAANINYMTEVMIFSEAYFKQLSYILSSTDNLALHNYLMWQFTSSYAPHLSANFRQIANRFHQALEGVSNPSVQKTERWEYCLGVTSEYLGQALGAMYIKHYFVPDSSKEAYNVEKKMQEVFRNYASHIPWTDDSDTRQIIKEKMDKLLSLRGYPDFILSPEALSSYYNELNVQGDFLQNIIKGKYFLRKKQESQLPPSQVTSDESWTIFPQDVQTIYHYHGNQLVVPAGILQEPFFDPASPLSVRFGSLGTHIGSQMFKALDDKGILYKNLGVLEPWLSGRSALQYQHKTDCLRNRLSDDEEETQFVSANLTVGQLIADIAAVKFAFKAYQDMERENELPGIGRNHDQVFFIAYAQSMCANVRTDKTQTWSDVSTSSSNQKRVVNTLRQLKEFSQAFGCPAGSPMNPGNTCHMW